MLSNVVEKDKVTFWTKSKNVFKRAFVTNSPLVTCKKTAQNKINALSKGAL